MGAVIKDPQRSFSYASGLFNRFPCIYRHLRRLVTHRHGECGLARVILLFILLFLFSFGAYAGSDRMSVGSPLQVSEPVGGDVTVFWSGARIDAPVEGNVTVIGGTLRLGDQARVRGDVVVFFGNLETAPGAVVRGDTLQVGAALFTASRSLPTRALLYLLLLWLTLGIGILFTLPTQVVLGAHLLRAHPWRALFTGLWVLLAGSAFLFLGFLLTPFYVGFPLIVIVIVALLAAKIYGTTLIVYALGKMILGRARLFPIFFTGILLIFILRLIPVAGPILWSFLTLPALGCAYLQIAQSVVLRRSLFAPPELSSDRSST